MMKKLIMTVVALLIVAITSCTESTDRLGNTGVGLAVNKSILELHKAKTGLDSNAESTTFWFEMKKAK